MSATSTASANRLIHETSPYLLQHAHNPVDWYPWGTEALTKAKDENKLILLSIGYAACHWCHVMEKESYEDPSVAAILNPNYVSIKIDREERPDLDAHFMEILTTMTGSGGWPLHLIVTPDLKPLYGGTYFPPNADQGRLSFKEVLTSLNTQWREQHDETIKNVQKLQAWLDQNKSVIPTGGGGRGEDPVKKAVRFWSMRADSRYGGFGDQPKFPHPLELSLFLRQAATTGDQALAKPALLALDRMAAGGIRDQLAGAFHRYATDQQWQIPHFEIMLYDNALLARVYLEAFQLTSQRRYAWVVQAILDDLLTRFRLTDGCFLSSLDADSDGEEGLFYTWSESEIIGVLGGESGKRFMTTFLDPTADLVAGRSVLSLQGSAEALMARHGDFSAEIAKLLQSRGTRPHPAKDDKVLTSWNGLMVSALAQSGAVLGIPHYVSVAKLCLNQLLTTPVHHSRRGQQVGEMVFLDDYAFLIQAMLDLYEVEFDVTLLIRAKKLAVEMVKRFQSAAGQPLQLTPLDRNLELPHRIELSDGVTPAGNSVAMIVLRRLAHLSKDVELEAESQNILTGLGQAISEQAAMVVELLHALDYSPETVMEIVIIQSEDRRETDALLQVVRQQLLPGRVLVVVDPKQTPPADWSLLAARPLLEGHATAYVCKNQVCRAPVATPKALSDLLAEKSGKMAMP